MVYDIKDHFYVRSCDTGPCLICSNEKRSLKDCLSGPENGGVGGLYM